MKWRETSPLIREWRVVGCDLLPTDALARVSCSIFETVPLRLRNRARGKTSGPERGHAVAETIVTELIGHGSEEIDQKVPAQRVAAAYSRPVVPWPLRATPGVMPITRLNIRLKAASDV